MNLTEARVALAAAVSTLPDITCSARPVPGNVRPGDAWVTVGRLTPGQFLGSSLQVLNAFVSLGSDETLADQKIDELSQPLLNCVGDLYAGDISVQAQEMRTYDSTGSFFALALSLTLELSE